MSEKYILCVTCRATFSPDEISGWGCPACGSKGVPADTRETASATLTHHEWRILCMWAENWASKVCAKDPTPSSDAVACVGAIIREIHRQAPDLGGLTMGEEVQEVADALRSEVEVRSDGKRETVKPAKRH